MPVADPRGSDWNVCSSAVFPPFLLSFLCKCVNIYCPLLPHVIDFVLLSSLRASSSLFVKEKESELGQSTEDAFTFQFVPFSLEIVAHCGWTGSRRFVAHQ